MKQTNTLPRVKDCIAYVERVGWKFSNRSSRSCYVFYNDKISAYGHNHQITFSLTELRHAFKSVVAKLIL